MEKSHSITTETAGGLTPIDLCVMGVYLASMIGMGLVIARRQKSTHDFFLAGRGLPAWAVGLSIFASLLSTITYLGMPGEMFRTGVSFLTRQLPVPLVLVVVLFVWIPFFMRLKLTSAYEYLEFRFNYTTRCLAAIFCLLLLFGWVSVVVLTASRALVEIANLNVPWFFGTNHPESPFRDADMHLVIISVGMFSVLYTTLGGIRAVIWTDVIQFFVLLAGALFTMAYIAWDTHSGIGEWISYSQQYKHEAVEWFDWDVRNRSTVFSISIGMFFWFTCTHGSNQVALQRYFSVKTIAAARKSYLFSAVASLAVGVVLAGVGVSLMFYMQDHDLPARKVIHTYSQQETTTLSDADKISLNDAQDNVFPQFISLHMPPFLRGLVVAALFAAAMSTIDSGANSTSTILIIDFLRPLTPSIMKSDGELRYARLLTATMGVTVVLYTLGLYHVSKGTDIITLSQKGFNCFLGPLGATFVLGMFFPRVTPRSLIPAFLIGEVFGIGSSFSEEFLAIPFSTHLVVPASWTITIVFALLFSVTLNTRATENQRSWTWIEVMRNRPAPS